MRFQFPNLSNLHIYRQKIHDYENWKDFQAYLSAQGHINVLFALCFQIIVQMYRQIQAHTHITFLKHVLRLQKIIRWNMFSKDYQGKHVFKRLLVGAERQKLSSACMCFCHNLQKLEVGSSKVENYKNAASAGWGGNQIFSEESVFLKLQFL